MPIQELLKPYLDHWATCDDTAIIEAWYDRSFSYADLYNYILQSDAAYCGRTIYPGSTHSIESIADFIAGALEGKIVVPCTNLQTKEFVPKEHPLYDSIASGLVLVSSGSTGRPKIALHDMEKFLAKFTRTKRPAKRTLAFLLWDHIGGLNTAFHTLFNGGTLVIPEAHDPATIRFTVNRYDVQVLPTTPTFLRLLCMAGQTDMPGLERITYGTEPMPMATLDLVLRAFPHVTLQQTYGASEIGILSTKSESSDSLWMKLGGDGFQTRVVNGLLEVKSESSMVGYLDHPSPFTEDGWYKTGDEVKERDGYYFIKGRASTIINVGGLKVYPAEIEDELLRAGAEQAHVTAMSNAITGQAVMAFVVGGDIQHMRNVCSDTLEDYKRPVKYVQVDSLVSERFKTKLLQ